MAPNAGAATWSAPTLLSDDGTRGPDMHLDDAGTVRFVEGVKSESVFDVATIRSGSSKANHCRVPGTDGNTPMARLTWEANSSGAMAAAWHEGGETGRVMVATGRRGRCFARARAVSPRGVGFDGMRMGAGGTVVAYWREAAGAGARLVAVTVPSDDGRVKRRTVFTVPTVRVSGVRADFTRDDRIVWTWLIEDGQEGPEYTQRLWGATSAARGGAAGKPSEIARVVGDPETTRLLSGGRLFTGADGGQVLAHTRGDGLELRVRKPGRPFGKPRLVVAQGDSSASFDGAMAPNGDAVFTWAAGRDVFAVSRRGGRFGAAQLLTPGESPTVADFPSAAISRDGRAAVAWMAQDAESHLISLSQIRVAVSSRAGAFKGSTVVSGEPRRFYRDPMVAVGGSGRAAVVWSRYIMSARGIEREEVMLARGKLGR